MATRRFTRRISISATAAVALIVGVAVVGHWGGLGRADGPRWWEDWEPTRRYYLDQAVVFERLEAEYRARASSIVAGATVARRRGEPEPKAERVAWSRAQAESFHQNAEEFRQIAARPWAAAEIHGQRTGLRR